MNETNNIFTIIFGLFIYLFCLFIDIFYAYNVKKINFY